MTVCLLLTYILLPSLEVKNKVIIKNEEEVIARDEKQKRSVADSFFFYFHCCSEPTPTFSPLSQASSAEILPSFLPLVKCYHMLAAPSLLSSICLPLC